MLVLPVDSYLEDILLSLSQHSRLILSAAPGAGKTTRLPPFLDRPQSRLKLGLSPHQKILVLEPRRIAAISAAQRIAEENGWALGQDVGYQVRFDNCASAKTRILFLTEALIAQKMSTDFELKDVGCVILDEFHERSATTDLTLGLLKDLQSLRPDLKIIVMSATLEQERLKDYLSPCELVEVPGQLFSLNRFYSQQPQPLVCNDSFYDRLLALIQTALHNKDCDDILVFLPGQSEIQRTLQKIQDQLRRNDVQIFPLHGQLSIEDQRAALAPLKSGKKIVLATNIAESSITIDGVNTVIDCGLEKLATWNEKTDSVSLELKRISISSSRQRAGRAARQKPGFAYGLWTAHDELSMPSFTLPQIHRSDLSQLLLLLSAQGMTQFLKFDWLTRPDPTRLQKAADRLQALQLTTDQGALTEIGKKVVHSPLDPDLGRLFYEFQLAGLQKTGADIVAILQEKDFLNFRNSGPTSTSFDCDLFFRWCLYHEKLQEHGDSRLLLKYNLSQIEKTSQQLKRQHWLNADDRFESEFESLNQEQQQLEIQKVFLKAWPHRLAERRSDGKNLLSLHGRGFEISPRNLCRKSHFVLMLKTFETEKSKDPICDQMLAVDENLLLTVLASRIQAKESLCYDFKSKKFKLVQRSEIGRLTIKSSDAADFDTDKLDALWPGFLRTEFDELLKKNSNFNLFWQRLQFLFKHKSLLGDSLQENILQIELQMDAHLDDFFKHISWNEKSFEVIQQKDLVAYLSTLLPVEFKRILDEQVPGFVISGKGKSFQIDYSGPEPTAELKIQEAFGWKTHPCVLSGACKLKLVLLAPNYRPTQITSDVISFWKTSYADVRKELKARYPKHDWPVDPTQIQMVK
jgi:ATP-dependent helicase HrpB